MRPGCNPGQIPGNAYVGGNIELTGGGSIVTTGNGNLVLLPNGSGITVVGDAGASSHALDANDDCQVTGRLEVDGSGFADGAWTVAGTLLATGQLTFVSSAANYARFYGTAGAVDQFLLALGSELGNQLVIGSYAWLTQDYDHPTQTNPTIFGHSATAPDTANDQWWSLTHDTNHAIDATGKGGKSIAPFNGAVYFDQAGQASACGGIIVIHTIVPISTVGATTTILSAPGAIVLGAAFRVSTEIAGLDAADHSLGLGVAGTADKYGTVSQGAADDHIHVNKKAHYHRAAAGDIETNDIILTIGGGADQTPTAGAVEVYIRYEFQTDLPDT
jgi:hypothetical protein